MVSKIGVVHGSVISCSPRFPGIYARLEDPTIFAFVKSLGSSYNQTVYTASVNVDCPWSLWSDCSENSMQSRRITRLLEHNGKDCKNKSNTSRSCEGKEKVYTCPEGYEIPFKLVCDGINHCGDNTDEENCPSKGKAFIN